MAAGQGRTRALAALAALALALLSVVAAQGRKREKRCFCESCAAHKRAGQLQDVCMSCVYSGPFLDCTRYSTDLL